MTSFPFRQLSSRVAWTIPMALVFPFVTGADGQGCQPAIVSTDAGASNDGGGGAADGGLVCTATSCDGIPKNLAAKVCPDGTFVTQSSCVDQGGQCNWAFPPCPTGGADACEALPCAPCQFGYTGMGKDANGCDTCPICSPPPAEDACPPAPICFLPDCIYGEIPQKNANGCDACPICAPPPAEDACPPAPICNLPNCEYGVIPQKDANGCDICAICAPRPDSGACDCGPPPPVAACPGGGSRSVTCASNSSGSCSWDVGPCPTAMDGGGKPCTLDSDCSNGDVCGFLETAACGTAGTCFPAPQIVCNAFLPGCGCDGSEVNTICNGLPSGYVRKPIKHTGVCVDGG